jgi:hypothetical protein
MEEKHLFSLPAINPYSMAVQPPTVKTYSLPNFH